MMKRIVILFAAALALLCSCEKPDTVIDEQSPEYSGRMTVIYENKPFDQDNVRVLVEFNEDKTAVDIQLCKVKFVPAMPVRIDVTIMEVPAVYVLRASSSAPSWAYAPFCNFMHSLRIDIPVTHAGSSRTFGCFLANS